MKLISMTDFVLSQKEKIWEEEMPYSEFIDKIINYAYFMKQPITLGMFVPCDENGKIIEEITQFDPDISSQYYAGQIWHNNLFNEAKERVLFKGNWKHKKEDITGFDTVDDDDFHFNLDTLECWQWVEGGILDFKLTGSNIESISNAIKGIELTESAIKQLGL